MAESATQLMRSRYSAFFLGQIEYLKKTWHPETCPEDLSAEEPSDWFSLEIVSSDESEDGTEASVEFIAKLVYDYHVEIIHEISDFDRLDGKWVYHSGEFVDDTKGPEKLSKKSDCPCGSGKKIKHCLYPASGPSCMEKRRAEYLQLLSYC